MNTQWITAAVLSSVLVAGCGGGAGDEGRDDTAAQPGTEETIDSAGDAGETAAGEAPAAPPVAPPAPSTGGDRSASAPRPAPARPAETSRADPGTRAEAPAPAPAAPVARYATIPAGTAIPVELTTALSSETAQIEAPVSGRLREDVVVNGVTVLPAGAELRGEVVDVVRPGRVQGRARLGIRFTSVTVDGERADLRTNPVVFEGEGTRGEDAAKVGAGAGVGAVIGGLLGGGSGAAKGAAIGGAAGAATVLATRGRDVELPVGSNINATLASDAEIRIR